MFSSRDRDALDRHITGNYGEDQFNQRLNDDIERPQMRKELKERVLNPCTCVKSGHPRCTARKHKCVCNRGSRNVTRTCRAKEHVE